MTYSSKNALICLGFLSRISVEDVAVSMCVFSSWIIPTACSTQRSQICALSPATNNLVSAFLRPQNEQLNSSSILTSGQYLVYHAVFFGF